MNENFNKLDRLIGITKYFPDVDKELMLLAINKKYTFNEKKLRERYAVKKMDYQTLEYLGDSVLDFITNSFLIDLYDLSLNGKEYNYIKSEFVKNNNLTRLSVHLGICNEFFPEYDISYKHNICSDTFEAILGALWLQYRDENIVKIRKWFFGIPEVYKNIVKIIGIEEEKIIPNLEKEDWVPQSRDWVPQSRDLVLRNGEQVIEEDRILQSVEKSPRENSPKSKSKKEEEEELFRDMIRKNKEIEKNLRLEKQNKEKEENKIEKEKRIARKNFIDILFREITDINVFEDKDSFIDTVNNNPQIAESVDTIIGKYSSLDKKQFIEKVKTKKFINMFRNAFGLDELLIKKMKYMIASDYYGYVDSYDLAFFISKIRGEYFLRTTFHLFDGILKSLGHYFYNREELQEQVDQYNINHNTKFILQFGQNDIFTEVYGNGKDGIWGIFLILNETVYTMSKLLITERNYLLYESILLKNINLKEYSYEKENIIASDINIPFHVPDTIKGFGMHPRNNLIQYKTSKEEKVITDKEVIEILNKEGIKYKETETDEKITLNEEETVAIISDYIKSNYKNTAFYTDNSYTYYISITTKNYYLYLYLSLVPRNKEILEEKKLVWNSSIIQRFYDLEISNIGASILL